MIRRKIIEMDFSEKWGKDVDEAIKLALLDLKVPIEEVDVTVLEESSKGFFGLGSKLAKVRVEKKKKEQKPEKTVKPETKPIKQERQEKTEKQERQEKPERAPERKTPEREPEKIQDKAPERATEKAAEKVAKRRFEKEETERPEGLVETNEHPALNFIKELTDKMELTLDIKAMENEECVYIDIEGEDAGTVIGKRGQTLDAVQYLASLVANKDKAKYIRVVVDAEKYRNKRRKTLEQLADRLAGKAVKTRRSVRLEPMNPYERKIIHARLQSNNRVITRSEGEEPYRRVVIELK